MARIQLGAGESAGISGTFDIFGTASGAEKVSILSSSGYYKFDPSFNRGGDTIELPGSIFDWAVMRSGSTAILFKDGISVNIPVGIAVTNIIFHNASTQLKMDLTVGKMYLGPTPLETTSAPALSSGSAPKFETPDKVYVDEGTTGAFRAVATDEDGDSTVKYALLETPDSKYFLIDSSTGSVRLKVPASYQTDKPQYVVSVLGVDATGLKAAHTVTVVIRDRSDSLPTFSTATATISVQEGQYITGYKATATQADSRDLIRYFIAGGADAGRFEIDQLSGQLAFKGGPTDFEKPGGAKGGNDYEVIVAAQDLARNLALQTVVVTVTDKADEASDDISTVSVAAGTLAMGSVTITCIENQMATGYVGVSQISSPGSYNFAISGADAPRFWINPGTGALYFRNGGADYEAQNSAAGTNNYRVTVIFTDGAGNKATQAVNVRVTNQIFEPNPQKGGDFINNTADGGITFFGNSADNLVSGTEKFDDLTGWTGNDFIRALGGNDYLRGDPGDDTLEGGAGDDRLMGNEGSDTAVYTCLSTQAKIKQESPGNFTVITPDEGRDSMPFSDMEFVRFANAEFSLDANLSLGTSFWTMSSKSALIGSSGNDVIRLSGEGLFVDGRDGNDVAYLDSIFDPILEQINQTSWRVVFGSDEYILTNVETLLANGRSYNLSLNLNNIQVGGAEKIFYGSNSIDLFVIKNTRQSIYNAGNSDKAIVFSDNYKTSSQVPTWEYASDTTKLPYWIDALLPNGAASFEARLVSHIVYFAFPDTAPSYLSGSELSEFSKFNDSQRSYVRKLLTYISTVTDLQFVETNDVGQSGTITFFNTNANPNLGGYARYPDAGTPFDMDNVVNITSEESAAIQHKAPAIDNWGGASLIHEVGHSLGLKHPFSSQGDEPSYLPAEEAIKTHSVMAYDGWSVTPTSWQFAELDLAALQYLYGPSRTARAGNDTYRVSAETNNFIWDGGGVDTIDLSDMADSCMVSLVPGFHGFIGDFSELITAPGQITINFGSDIENLKGSTAGDQLFGNDLDNVVDGGAGDDWVYGGLGNDQLTGGLGNDVIFGGLGEDTAQFNGDRSEYTISRSDSQLIVTSLREGRDILCDIERLIFKDQTVVVSDIPSGGTFG